MAAFEVDHPVTQQGWAFSIAEPAAPSAVLSRLRLETRREHEAVEQVLDLMSPSLTREGYRQRLEQFYGFYAPLEAALQARSERKGDHAGESALSWGTRSALASRLDKATRLQQDLYGLGVTARRLPRCGELPPLGSQAEVLGCLYVLEGATLGGRLITQHVRATLGITPTTGGSFFQGYGNETGKMWQTMRQLLVSGAPDQQTEDTIVLNAIATFACLRGWCESRQKQIEMDPETNSHA